MSRILHVISLVISASSLPFGAMLIFFGRGSGFDGMGAAILAFFWMICALLGAFALAVIASCLPGRGRWLGFLSIPLPLMVGFWGIPALMSW